MRTVISNKIHIYDCPMDVYWWVRDNLTITNPLWLQMKKLGKEEMISRKHIPEQMKLYVESGSDLIVPFGCLNSIWDMIKDSPYEVRFNDNGKVIDPNMQISMPLYDYQEEAVKKMLGARGGVLQASAGSGKTQIGIEVIKRLGLNALWLCHTGDLCRQTIKRIHMLYPKISVGTITEGEVNMVNNGITVSTIQTLVNVDPDVYRDNFDVVVCDECFSGDTEILTENGFVRFDELQKNVKVAQYENGKITYVLPTRYIEKETDKIAHFKWNNIDIKTTLNHNMVCKNSSALECVKTAYEMVNYKGSKYSFITSAEIDIDNTQQLDDYDRILIMLQADGCLYHKGKTEDTYKLEFSKQRKIDRFKMLCNNAGIVYKEYSKRHFANNKWKDSTKFTIKMPHNENRYKLLTDFLQQPLNRQYARDIIEEISHWDGHIRKSGSIEYDSAIKENVDFVKLCAFMGGMSSSQIIHLKRKSEKYSDLYRVYVNEQISFNYHRFKKFIKEEKLKVYCVEVPSHKIIVRKDGFIFVCGNCHHVTGTPTMMKMFNKVMERVPARYKFGLSATPNRSDTMIKSMYAIIGCNLKGEFAPIHIIEKEKTNTLTAKHNKIELQTKFSWTTLNEDGSFNYSALVEYLGQDQERNQIIIDNVIKVLDKHAKQIVLCQRIEQCETINSMFQERGINSVLLVGKVTKKKREEILNSKKDWNVIVGTLALAKEGLDVPELSALHWAMVIGDKTATIQSAGRIERVCEGKPEPEIYDYVDVNYPYCIGKYKKRVSYLKKR